MTSPALPIYRKHRERRVINDALGTQPAKTDRETLQDRPLQQQELQGKEMKWTPGSEKTLSKAMCGPMAPESNKQTVKKQQQQQGSLNT